MASAVPLAHHAGETIRDIRLDRLGEQFYGSRERRKGFGSPIQFQ